VANSRCIWCLKEKPEEEFNREHVMPEAYGTFEGSLTLVKVVCEACNSFFAKELEPWLARDGSEGFDRYHHGEKPTSEFKSLGKRSTTRMQLTEGPHAGAWAYAVAREKALGLTPFPQIGFARRAEDATAKYYALDALPTIEELLAEGYAGELHIRLCEASEEEAVPLLLEKGIKWKLTATFPAPTGGTWVDAVFRPTVNHRRALAKIAFNYLASQFGPAVAFEERFDAIRRFVMEGVEPEGPYWTVSSKPVMVTPATKEGTRPYGHFLVIRELPGGEVQGTVSIFHRLRWSFLLARKPGSKLGIRGHYFDVKNRRVIPLPFDDGASGKPGA
jgi:hypothetical protein